MRQSSSLTCEQPTCSRRWRTTLAATALLAILVYAGARSFYAWAISPPPSGNQPAGNSYNVQLAQWSAALEPVRDVVIDANCVQLIAAAPGASLDDLPPETLPMLRYVLAPARLTQTEPAPLLLVYRPDPSGGTDRSGSDDAQVLARLSPDLALVREESSQ